MKQKTEIMETEMTYFILKLIYISSWFFN